MLARAVLAAVVVAAALPAVPAPADTHDTASGGLCDSEGVAQFGDVADSEYAAAYILCARALGLTRGTASGGYEPDSKLSRAQMAAFLARLWRDNLDKPCPSEPRHTFGDVDSSFAAADIACLYALGITKGTTAATYSPSADLDTAAVTRFTARLLDKARPGSCDLNGDELAQAADCLHRLNIAPSTVEATAYEPTTRSQMAVYLIGAWHHASGRGQPPQPPARPRPAPTSAVVNAAFARLNEGRAAAGLNRFMRAVEGDSAFIPIFEFFIGCDETIDQHPELLQSDIHALFLAESPGASECALKAVPHHYVPDSEKLRVERSVWECFIESTDIREGRDTSCGGRFSYIDGHVRWLPAVARYTIVEGEALHDKFRSVIPWIEEKLKMRVRRAQSAEHADLLLHLGVESVGACPERYGCNRYEDTGDRQFATVYVSAPDQYFDQVLKHELLHALLPMGHLPAGNHLMSVRTDDPSAAQTLSALEEKLLALYTHPYLRDGMRMELFRRYLIIWG